MSENYIFSDDAHVTTSFSEANKTSMPSNISCTLVGYKTVYHSDVVGASPVGDTPTTSIFST